MNPSPDTSARPVAERMRPRTLDEVAGHIPSMVFRGPPGVGETTLALLALRSLSLRERAGVRDSAETISTEPRRQLGNPR